VCARFIGVSVSAAPFHPREAQCAALKVVTKGGGGGGPSTKAHKVLGDLPGHFERPLLIEDQFPSALGSLQNVKDVRFHVRC